MWPAIVYEQMILLDNFRIRGRKFDRYSGFTTKSSINGSGVFVLDFDLSNWKPGGRMIQNFFTLPSVASSAIYFVRSLQAFTSAVQGVDFAAHFPSVSNHYIPTHATSLYHPGYSCKPSGAKPSNRRMKRRVR